MPCIDVIEIVVCAVIQILFVIIGTEMN